MPTIHDPAHRTHLSERVKALRPDSQRQWGKMSVDQMLWHVNTALEMALGRIRLTSDRRPLPRPIMRFVVLSLPWPKNAPTNPGLIPAGNYDFEMEQRRCVQLMEDLAQKDIYGGSWADHPLLGSMPGPKVSQLQAKHVDHHLRQFGV